MTFVETVTEFIQRAQAFGEYMAEVGVPVVFHTWYRGPAEQEDAYRRGASNARFGQSAHNYYLALDYHFQHEGYNAPKAYWEFGAQVAKWAGLESGISYGDANHIQFPGWRKWKV